jgi:hypothetical protein
MLVCTPTTRLRSDQITFTIPSRLEYLLSITLTKLSIRSRLTRSPTEPLDHEINTRLEFTSYPSHRRPRFKVTFTGETFDRSRLKYQTWLESTTFTLIKLTIRLPLHQSCSSIDALYVNPRSLRSDHISIKAAASIIDPLYVHRRSFFDHVYHQSRSFKHRS